MLICADPGASSHLQIGSPLHLARQGRRRGVVGRARLRGEGGDVQAHRLRRAPQGDRRGPRLGDERHHLRPRDERLELPGVRRRGSPRSRRGCPSPTSTTTTSPRRRRRQILKAGVELHHDVRDCAAVLTYLTYKGELAGGARGCSPCTGRSPTTWTGAPTRAR